MEHIGIGNIKVPHLIERSSLKIRVFFSSSGIGSNLNKLESANLMPN